MNSIAEVMSSNMAGDNPAMLSSYSHPMTPGQYRQPAPAPIVTRPHRGTPRNPSSPPYPPRTQHARPKTPVSARACRPPTPELRIPQDCPFPVFPGFERPRTPGASPPGTPRSGRRTHTSSRPGTAGTMAASVAEVVPPVPTLPSPQEPVKAKPRPGFFRRLFSSKKDVKVARSDEKTTTSPVSPPVRASPTNATRPGTPVRSATADAGLGIQNAASTAPATTDDLPLLSLPLRQLRSTASTPDLGGKSLNRQQRPSPLTDQGVRSLPIPSKSLRRPPMPTFNTEPPVPLKSPLRTEPLSRERRQSLPDTSPRKPTNESSQPSSPTEPVQAFAVSNAKLERAPQLLLAIAALKASVGSGNGSEHAETGTGSSDLDIRPDTPASHYSGASSTEQPDGSVSTAHTSPDGSPKLDSDQDALDEEATSRPAIAPPKSMADIAASLRDFRHLSLDSEHEQTPSPSKVRTLLLPSPPLLSRASSSNSSTSTFKPTCRGCGAEITGRSVKAADDSLSGRYHKECFTCHTCSTPLDAVCYIMRDRPYCGFHYHDLNGSLCATCGLGIEGGFVEMEAETAEEEGRKEGGGKRKCHVDCFKCETCGEKLTECHFEVGGKWYCEVDGARAWAEMREGLGRDGREVVLERRKTRVLCAPV